MDLRAIEEKIRLVDQRRVRLNTHIKAPAKIAHSRNPKRNPRPEYRTAAAGASGAVSSLPLFCAGRGPIPTAIPPKCGRLHPA